MSVPSTEKCSSDKQRRHVLVRQDRGQELAGDIGVQEPVAVLRKHGWHPHRIVNAKPHEPAEQEIVLHLLHELALRADREQDLDQSGAQQPLGCNGRAAIGGVKLGELRVERCQRGVHNRKDFAQRVVRPNPVLQVHIAEQAPVPNVRSPHVRPRCSHAEKESYSRSPVSNGVFQQPASGPIPAFASPCSTLESKCR